MKIKIEYVANKYNIEMEYNTTAQMKEEVPGLYYFENVIDEEDAAALLEEIDGHEWKAISQSTTGRKVQQYGYEYNYKSKDILAADLQICGELYRLRKRLYDICWTCGSFDSEMSGREFSQCIVNNYDPGQGIGKHIDLNSFGPAIACFSLGSAAIVRFRKGAEAADLYIQPRSLYIMTGAARYEYTHEMPGTKYDRIAGQKIKRNRRVSITFRQV